MKPNPTLGSDSAAVRFLGAFSCLSSVMGARSLLRVASVEAPPVSKFSHGHVNVKIPIVLCAVMGIKPQQKCDLTQLVFMIKKKKRKKKIGFQIGNVRGREVMFSLER